jgi:hypothetical protein
VSIQFSRSMRSLSLDSYRASQIAMILATILMLALILWFLLAKVTIYESSSSVSLTEDGRVVGVFRPESMRRIQPGQKGYLRLNTRADQPVASYPAVVVSISQDTNEVEFFVYPGENLQDFQPGKLDGRINVAAETITPARLVLRATGKYLDQSPLNTTTPQEQAP